MKKVLFTFIILLSMASLFFYYLSNQQKKTENELNLCIQNILLADSIDTIIVDTKNRKKLPILKGTASKKDKNKIIKLINKNCQVSVVQDFIDVLPNLPNNQAFLNFSTDEFNNIISIKGAFNNQVEFDQILQSFNAAKPDMQIQHDVKIDSTIASSDFSVDITLLLSSIDEIHVADISIDNGNLILKGLIRDKITELETMDKLHQLFDDEYTIINNLQQVADSETEINDLKFDLLPMPEFNNPIQKKQQ